MYFDKDCKISAEEWTPGLLRIISRRRLRAVIHDARRARRDYREILARATIDLQNASKKSHLSCYVYRENIAAYLAKTNRELRRAKAERRRRRAL